MVLLDSHRPVQFQDQQGRVMEEVLPNPELIGQTHTRIIRIIQSFKIVLQ